jgi:hypothetical protein
MNKTSMLCVASLLLAIFAAALSLMLWTQLRRKESPVEPPPGQPQKSDSWLQGSSDDKLKQVEKQLRGFDKTMVEVGYRFTELYFAGKDGNWEYANYQVEKIQAAIRLGLERRPKRAESAKSFMDQDLPAIEKTVKARDPQAFTSGIENLRMACMRCHVNEKVQYFTVEMPEHRRSPIRTLR